MQRWFDLAVRFATWRVFGAFFLVWAFYSWVGLNMPGAWTRAMAAAKGMLPDLALGFPPDEPMRSLDALKDGGAIGDYLAWQALDVPYAALNALVLSLALGLGLKALRLEAGRAKWVLALPLAYLAGEAIENSLVSLFALAPGAAVAPLVVLQQAGTSLKLLAGWLTAWPALAALAVAAGLGIWRRLKPKAKT